MTPSLFITTQWLADHLDQVGQSIVLIEASLLFDGSATSFNDQVKTAYPLYLKSHIPGAYYLNQLDTNQHDFLHFQAKSNQAFLFHLSQFGWSPDKLLIIYDRGPEIHMTSAASIWAARLAWQCYLAGCTHLAILEGGWLKWQRENRPTSQTLPPLYPPKTYSLKAQPHLKAEQAQVVQASKIADSLLIDALSPAQYNGQLCPFGPDKAGHIPKAFNLFFDNFTDNHSLTLLSEAQVLDQLKHIIPQKNHPLISYCGFGVAATWIWAVLTHYGYTDVKVYDGSLEEWVQTHPTSLN